MIKEQEECLFLEWKNSRAFDLFLTDGIFDVDEWQKQSTKILFVLKEANFKSTQNTSSNKLDIKNFNNDLRAYLLSEKSPTYWKTWNNIVRWTQAIREGGSYQKKITKADKTQYLKTIAAINIKKEAGGATAITNEIIRHGKDDYDFLIRQIELYQPDIIICCGKGTDILYNGILPNKSKQESIEEYDCFLYKLKSEKEIPIIQFCHPQMRGGHAGFEKRYMDMIKIAEELRKRKCL